MWLLHPCPISRRMRDFSKDSIVLTVPIQFKLSYVNLLSINTSLTMNNSCIRYGKIYLSGG